jgi:trans-aconitate methyltransferase
MQYVVYVLLRYLFLQRIFIEDQMTQLDFNSNNLRTLFREIGLYSPADQFYKARTRKHQQILAYIPQINNVFNKLSTKRPVVLLDCCCGKSYLSFVLYEYCTAMLKRKIKIIGVDSNSDLIAKCNNSAKELGFTNMQFYQANVGEFRPDEKVDVVYSLHACDHATDYTIAQGIKLDVQYIFSVSCCQHTNRERMSSHPLTSISRFRPYKERLADMVGDTMRALLLENLGYGVDIFEFVASIQTPKNIMLRAIRNSAKNQERSEAIVRYKQLVNMFNFMPELANLLR